MADSKSKLLEAVKEGNLEIVKEMLNSHCLLSKAKKKSKLDYLTRQDKYDVFMEAVMKKQLEIVKHLISSGLNFVNNQHIKSSKTTPLHIAIENNDIEMFKILLTNGANIQAVDEEERSPLCLAAKLNNVEIVRLILEPCKLKRPYYCGWVTNYKGKHGSALHEAIRSDSEDIIKILLGEYACDPEGLDEAITGGKMDIIDYFIDHYKSALSISILKTFYAEYMFRRAINLNQVNVVEHLLNTREIDINKRDDIFHKLPLELAIQSSHEAMVDYLLEHGAQCTDRSVLYIAIWNKEDCKFLEKFLQMKIFDLNQRISRFGWDLPLNVAAASNNVEAVKLLLHYGAIANVQSHGRRYPLHCAVESKSTEIAKILLDHGASVNFIGGSYIYSEATPLHIAVQNKQIEMIQLLLDYGATITFTEGTMTPLDCAARYESLEIVELLLIKGVFHGNSLRRLMSSAVYYAAANGNSQMVKLFLKKGITLRTTENTAYDKPPLHVASAKGYLEIFKVLLAELLAQGGSVDDCYDQSITALHCVVRDGFAKFTETRKSNIPQYVTRDHEDRKEIIEILLAHGANIDARDIDDMTPLHYSVYQIEDSAAAVFLIKRGADFNAEDNQGSTVIDYCVIDKNIEFGKKLITEIVLRVQMDNAYLSEKVLQEINKIKEWKKFYERCVKEAQGFKKEKFSKCNVTLVDIIRIKDVKRLVAYARNQNIVEYLEAGYYRLKFIIYGQTIQDHFAPAILRRDLLDHQNVKDFFNFLSDKNGATLQNLPATFTNEVFAYLSNEDLENVKRSARFLRV